MQPARKKHIQFNRATAGLWSDFAGHREQVMAMLCDAPSAGSIGVLGAGNCNDLDLRRLCSVFDDVHLLDVDGEAMQAAVARQGADPVKLTLHGDRDLGGFLELLDTRPQAEACRRKINRLALPEFAGRFDVAASVCLLSQMGYTLTRFFEPDEAACLAVGEALQRRHIALLGELVRPGGRVVLITDFMGSNGFPKLSLCDDADFPAVVEEGLANNRFYKNTTPAILRQNIAQQPGVIALEAEGPWRWIMWPTHFAVCGFSWRTSPG